MGSLTLNPDSLNLKLSQALVAFFKESGVKRVVLCPGSRNAPLIFSVKNSSFTTYTHLDERSAAFFALGLAVAFGERVAVITTSGTAAAELLPAVVEAYYQGVEILCVTADRPTVFRGTGAPQAIEQQRIFSSYARFFDIERAEDFLALMNTETAKALHKIPLHLNICLEEPAEGDWIRGRLDSENAGI